MKRNVFVPLLLVALVVGSMVAFSPTKYSQASEPRF